MMQPFRNPGLRRRIMPHALALAVSAAAVSPTQAAAADPQGSVGLWSGTVTLSATGQWDYTIGYRSDGERRRQGSSSHRLNWTMNVTDARGGSDFRDFTGESGSATLSSFAWSGSATNAGQNDCQYEASGSMNASAADGFSFQGVGDDGTPALGNPDSDVIPLSVARSACDPGIIFGFSGPNAATLGEDGGYDRFLLNYHVDYGPAQPPDFTLCTEPVRMQSVPTATTDSSGRTVVQGTTTGECSGRRVEWFGDSDVHHDSAVALTYTWDLTFEPTCNSGFVSRDWLGFSQGDLLSATTPDSSYGLAIRWCTKPNQSTDLQSANVRVDENRGGGNLDALGRAIESVTIDINQRWVPDESQTVTEKQLPGGGLRVTAATGHFDVCVGLGGPLFGVGRRAFGLLPKSARKKLARKFEDSATNGIERLYDRDYKRIKKELVGEINPETGKKYTRHARRKEAKRVAGRMRRARYELLEFLTERLIEEADFKGCLRAWEPKIVATIAVDGSLAGISENGYTRGWLWRIREDDQSGACEGRGCIE